MEVLPFYTTNTIAVCNMQILLRRFLQIDYWLCFFEMG